ALETGLVLPRIRAKDDKRIASNRYEIRVHDAKTSGGEILVDRALAIDPGDAEGELDGRRTKDPTYGLPAVWIAEEETERARKAGYTVVEPLQVLTTHLTEVLRQHAPNLLSRSETERMVDR